MLRMHACMLNMELLFLLCRNSKRAQLVFYNCKEGGVKPLMQAGCRARSNTAAQSGLGVNSRAAYQSKRQRQGGVWKMGGQAGVACAPQGQGWVIQVQHGALL
jgi:hypothetical protein